MQQVTALRNKAYTDFKQRVDNTTLVTAKQTKQFKTTKQTNDNFEYEPDSSVQCHQTFSQRKQHYDNSSVTRRLKFD